MAAAFEKLSLKTKIDAAHGFLDMIRNNTSIGLIVLDEQGHSVFSNIMADQICSRLVKKDAWGGFKNKTGGFLPRILIDECRSNPGQPYGFKKKLSAGPGETYLVKVFNIDRGGKKRQGLWNQTTYQLILFLGGCIRHQCMPDNPSMTGTQLSGEALLKIR